MQFPKDEFQAVIAYPLGGLLVFLFLWKCLFSRLACCLGLPDRALNTAVVTLTYVSALQRSSPYEGKFTPTLFYVEMTLLFAASHYLRAAFCSESKLDMTFNLTLVISILDLITLKQGGDVGIYFIFLLEAPDLFSLYLAPLMKSEDCFEFLYTLLYITCRVVLLGHITYLILVNSRVSEDIKMNFSILFLFSIMCFPAMLISCLQSCMSSFSCMVSMLPQANRTCTPGPPPKPCEGGSRPPSFCSHYS